MKRKNKILLIFLIINSFTALAFDKQELIPTKVTIMEENDSVVFKGISSMALSPDEKILAVIDISGYFVTTLSIDSGKIQNSFFTQSNLNSSIIVNDTYYQSTVINEYPFIISNQNANQLGLSSDDILNDFKFVYFLSNNNLIVSGTLRFFMVDSTAKKRTLSNIGAFHILNSKLQLVKSMPLECTTPEYSLGHICFPLDDFTYLASVSNYLTSNDDSLSLFSLFDNQGRHKKLITKLPYDYIESELRYKLSQFPQMLKLKNKIFWTTQMDYKIRGLFDTSYFEIQGFDSTNFYTWIDYQKAIENCKIKKEKSSVKLRLAINGLDAYKDSLLAVQLVNNEGYHVQFYTEKGELVNHFALIPPNELKIRKLVIANYANKLIAVASNDENYFIVEYYLPE